ncbi:MAG: hypothetical protein Kow0040_28730 [Thermogutta sp.]
MRLQGRCIGRIVELRLPGPVVAGIAAIAVSISLTPWSGAAGQQPPVPPAPPAAAPPAPAQAPTRQRLPAPIEVGGSDLLTKDGVQIRATFYPSTLGKEAVPVILLHGWKGSRRDFARLAPVLQAAGHAVLVPDLRGHGDSTQRMAGGSTVTITVDRMPPAEVARMVQFDLETCKAFLKQKHNAGELNIEKLSLIGLDVGATVALDWARLDWSWPIYPGLKQGQDVKALVLISPRWSVPGLSVQAALNHPGVRQQISVYIIVGQESSRDSGDAQRIYNLLARFHREPDPGQTVEGQDLFFVKFATSLQGRELMARFEQPIFDSILSFLDDRAAQLPVPWQERTGRK